MRGNDLYMVSLRVRLEIIFLRCAENGRHSEDSVVSRHEDAFGEEVLLLEGIDNGEIGDELTWVNDR